MITAQHTPGPWFVSTATHLTLGAILAVSAKEGDGVDAVCIVDLLPGDEESKANAHLIAAAPDLLEALKLCEGNISSLLASTHPRVYGEWLDFVRAAIAKAEGGAA